MAGALNLHRPFQTENALALKKELQTRHTKSAYFMTMWPEKNRVLGVYMFSRG